MVHVPDIIILIKNNGKMNIYFTVGCLTRRVSEKFI